MDEEKNTFNETETSAPGAPEPPLEEITPAPGVSPSTIPGLEEETPKSKKGIIAIVIIAVLVLCAIGVKLNLDRKELEKKESIAAVVSEKIGAPTDDDTSFTYSSKDKMYISSFRFDDMSYLALLSISPNSLFTEADWDEYTPIMLDIYDLMKGHLESFDDTETSLCVELISDVDKETTLLKVIDGELVYDITSDIKDPEELQKKLGFDKELPAEDKIAIASIVSDSLESESLIYSEKENLYILNTVTEGLASATEKLIDTHDPGREEKWNELKDAQVALCQYLKGFVMVCGDPKTSVCINLVSDLEPDKVLVTVIDGEITYDIYEEALD